MKWARDIFHLEVSQVFLIKKCVHNITKILYKTHGIQYGIILNDNQLLFPQFTEWPAQYTLRIKHVWNNIKILQAFSIAKCFRPFLDHKCAYYRLVSWRSRMTKGLCTALSMIIYVNVDNDEFSNNEWIGCETLPDTMIEWFGSVYLPICAFFHWFYRHYQY